MIISSVDVNTVNAIVAGMAGAIWLAGWLGWTLGRRAGDKVCREFWKLGRDLGYAQGYRDGKNNRRRSDRDAAASRMTKSIVYETDQAVRAVADAPLDAYWGDLPVSKRFPPKRRRGQDDRDQQ